MTKPFIKQHERKTQRIAPSKQGFHSSKVNLSIVEHDNPTICQPQVYYEQYWPYWRCSLVVVLQLRTLAAGFRLLFEAQLTSKRKAARTERRLGREEQLGSLQLASSKEGRTTTQKRWEKSSCNPGGKLETFARTCCCCH